MGAGDDATSGDWVMEIDSEVKMIERLKNQERKAWKKHSIYKLPNGFVRDEKRLQAYTPQVVSFGPYHYEEPRLKAMEEHKRRALRHFLARTNKSLKEYREALKDSRGGVVQLLMDSYKDLDQRWRKDEDRFLKMMILDGCFMMEVMKLATGKISQQQQVQDYDANDPIFSHHGMLSNLPRIKRDMLMIENQIPLLVLHKLHAVEMGIHEQDKEKEMQWVNNVVLEFFEQKTIETPPSLFKRAEKSFKRAEKSFVRWASKVGAPVPSSNNSKTPSSSTAMPQPPTAKQSSDPPAASTDDHVDADVQEYMHMGLHVLDVVRKSMIKADEMNRRVPESQPSLDVIWTATHLQEAGIKFQESKSPGLQDIAFQKAGLHGLRATLSLPQMVVDDATESKFLNLMAFEHLHMGSGQEVSSYVCFMDNIIDSDKDVSLLSENNIIKNFVGTDQAVAELFNGISRDVSIDPTSYLNEVHRDVTAYCNSTFNKYYANLKRVYFNTPWSVIAFIAATVALVITIIQFVYTFLSYYNHDS